MTPCRIFTVVAALAATLTSSAVPTLYYSPALTTGGFGQPDSHQLTTAVTDAFGAGNIFQVADFSNASAYAGADALFINARAQNGQTGDALSASEKTNISSFINGGGAVFFVGDHGSWANWDNSFLNLFGDQFTTWSSVGAAFATDAANGQFTAGSKVLLTAPGAISGGNGAKLYTAFNGGLGQTMAAVYGPKSNAIAFLDTNGLIGNRTEHLDFYASVSSWLYTTASAHDAAQNQPPTTPPAKVPDSSVAGALCLALFACFAAVRRSRRV